MLAARGSADTWNRFGMLIDSKSGHIPLIKYQLPGVEFFGADVVGCDGWLFVVGCRNFNQVLRQKRADG
jgi:hypothetical protein